MSENVQLPTENRTIGQSQDAMREIYGVGQQTAQKQRRRERFAAKQGGICPACRSPLPEDLTETEIDHIIPRARGGPNLLWNKRLVHFKCNRSKWANLIPEARALAVKYGITLTELGARPVATEKRTWADGGSLRMYPRQCNWCGTTVVVTIDDPDVFVACTRCHDLHGDPPAEDYEKDEPACLRCRQWDSNCKCPRRAATPEPQSEARETGKQG